jgi:hypothetical protein
MQMTTRLYQSVSPSAAEPALEEQQDEATIAAAVPLLLAHGEVVNVRSGGVAAIRLETETLAIPTPSAPVPVPVSTDNVISSSAPAIKAATKKQKQNKPSQGKYKHFHNRTYLLVIFRQLLSFCFSSANIISSQYI